MGEARWDRMWSHFYRALEMAPGEREAFLEQACGDQPELLAEVHRMLAGHDGAASVLDGLRTDEDEVDDPMVGQRVGAYRIERVIGHGGMGTVYQAEQEQPIRRPVALKLIRLGMDTEEVVARFESERQALALMDHPNIATVFDAGASAEGRPFFVMELVSGQPITEYCDCKQLDLSQRLELFVSVCHAVQHAHHKGLVHRDLKPSNILVTGRDGHATVKIIDFGIAKAMEHRLTDKSLHTERDRTFGTPGYMSPEQAAQAADVDTRADVYSLGVVFYELLVGEMPIESLGMSGKSPAEIVRALSTTDPATPSHRVKTLGAAASPIAKQRRTDATSLHRQLKGELDWIVMRALARERDHRYATPVELASDIRRYMQRLPVIAGPPGAGYRLRTFFRRHRFGVSVAASLSVALFLGLVGTTWMAVLANRQKIAAEEARDQAQKDAEIARAVSGFLDELLSAPDPMRMKSTGLEIKVIDIVDDASEALDTFRDQPEVESALRRTLGRTYLNLGKKDEAEAQFSRAVEICTSVLGEDHPDTLASQHYLALALKSKGKMEEGEALLRSTLERRRQILGREHRDTMSTMLNLGNAMYVQDHYVEAEELLRELLLMQQSVLGAEDPDTITTMSSLVFVTNRQGQHKEAVALARQVLDQRRRTLGEENYRTLTSLGNLATVLVAEGSLEQARSHFQDQLRLLKKVVGDDHPVTLLATQNLASVLTRLERPDEALPLFRAVYQHTKTAQNPSHPRSLITAHNYARTLTEAGEAARAEEIYREILSLARNVYGPKHYIVAMFEGGLGVSLLRLGHLQEAEEHLLFSHEGLERAFGKNHPSVATARQRLMTLYQEWNRPEEAARFLDP